MQENADQRVADAVLDRIIARRLAGESDIAVGLDVFDTIVTRRMPKEFALEFLCYSIALQFLGDESRAPAVRDAYQAAYIPECERNAAAGLCFEAMTEPLFTAWARLLLKHGIRINGDRLQDYVVKIEIGQLWVIPATRWLLENLRVNGVFIFYVSDMFLGRRAVDAILDRLGVLSFFDFGIVSSDIARLKRTGAMFDHLIGAGRIDPAKTIFVGDDRLADYEMPISRNIESFHYLLPELDEYKSKTLAEFRRAEVDNSLPKLFKSYGSTVPT